MLYSSNMVYGQSTGIYFNVKYSFKERCVSM